jgi:hypothetical protein
VTLVLLGRDLFTASRVFEAAARAGVEAQRVDDPADLPSADRVRLLLVDWGDRGSDWGEQISRWRATTSESAQPRIVLFGPHVDRAAHAAAKAAGLGPMRARSTLSADISRLLG